MPNIELTNIIIDDFSKAKTSRDRIYTHILTHIHTDHLKGLYDGWNYGPIYCTRATQHLLLQRYPSLTCLNPLELNKPTQIKMSNTLSVTVTFLDANHCVGAVMVLIQGYMGCVLYTGDIRFNRAIFEHYSLLYPPQKLNPSFQACSKHVDVLYLDNTFLKSKFHFPPQRESIQMAIQFIQHILNLNEHTRIYIGLDTIGKEEVLVAIAQHFNMYIVVDNQRYQQLKVMEGIDLELFTTRPDEGVVEVVRKDQICPILLKNEEAMGLIMSGWVNEPKYRLKGRIYCLPYSLHSNYDEIHEFVKSIKPSFLYPIVHSFPNENRFFYAQTTATKRDLIFNQQMFETMEGNYQSQLDLLRSLYCTPATAEYRLLVEDFQLQKKIEKELLPPKMPEFQNEKLMPQVHFQQAAKGKKYQIKKVRNEEEMKEINRLRNRIEMKRKLVEGEVIESIEDSDAIVIQAKNSKDHEEGSVIDLEEEDQVVEVDPFSERRSTGRKSNKPYKDHDQSIIQEMLRDKIKNRQKSNSSKIEEEPVAILPREPIKSELQEHSNEKYTQTCQEKPRREQPQLAPFKRKSNKVSIANIDLDRIDEISFLKTKRQIERYLKGHPEDKLEILRNFQKENVR